MLKSFVVKSLIGVQVLLVSHWPNGPYGPISALENTSFLALNIQA
jgi:hypothetical protein